ncbi:MAG: hypothetical protein M1820_007704 [Bogoriella megaspora]|nr:MAG: hypothetical protein M1820_007704 [Bogoriella megaspora]
MKSDTLAFAALYLAMQSAAAPAVTASQTSTATSTTLSSGPSLTVHPLATFTPESDLEKRHHVLSFMTRPSSTISSGPSPTGDPLTSSTPQSELGKRPQVCGPYNDWCRSVHPPEVLSFQRGIPPVTPTKR